jgi:transposase
LEKTVNVKESKDSRRNYINPLNAELNPICHLLALLGAHHIFHVSGLRVNVLCLALYMCKMKSILSN